MLSISAPTSRCKKDGIIMAEIGPSGFWGFFEALLTMIPNFEILRPETAYDCPGGMC